MRSRQREGFVLPLLPSLPSADLRKLKRGLILRLKTPCDFILVKSWEKDLARHCLDFSRTLLDVESTLLPHLTCNYMYDCSQLFSKFYAHCEVRLGPLPQQKQRFTETARAPQVGKAETPELKASRLALCVVVVNTLKVGFDLLGMDTIDAM